jgi:AraC-like DNA-binding protein
MSLMRAAVLANYDDVVRQLGLNPEAHLRAVGLSPQMLRMPDQLISSDAVAKLLENVATKSGCDTVGLRMSEPRSMSQLGVVSLLLCQQRTMREALQLGFKYLPLMNASLALQLEEDGGTTLLREEVLTNDPLPSHQTIELAMTTNVRLFRTIIGRDWHPQRVYFRHAPPKSLELHHRIFGCKCEFLCDLNAMSFRTRDLDIPNLSADPLMAKYALGFIETLVDRDAASITTEVRRSIYLLLPLGKATIKQVAQSLGCSVRKLQLDLERVGSSFGHLLEDARRERVRLYLENSKFEMAQISSLLGYSHQSSFARWFSRQFGMSPGAWQESLDRARPLSANRE